MGLIELGAFAGGWALLCAAVFLGVSAILILITKIFDL